MHTGQDVMACAGAGYQKKRLGRGGSGFRVIETFDRNTAALRRRETFYMRMSDGGVTSVYQPQGVWWLAVPETRSP